VSRPLQARAKKECERGNVRATLVHRESFVPPRDAFICVFIACGAA
jgi:hypothetical protein